MRPTPCRMVLFVPPSACVTPLTPKSGYPSIVTEENADGTFELTTFGKNSIYFQHNVPFSEEPKPGHCHFPPRS